MKAYSLDLRKRVMEYIDEGDTHQEVHTSFLMMLFFSMREHPDVHLRDAAFYFKCGKTFVYQAFKRLGITRKKQRIYRERDEEKKKKFVALVNIMPKKRLIFVDEPWNCGHSEAK